MPREAGRSGAGGGARDAPAPGTGSPPPPRTPAPLPRSQRRPLQYRAAGRARGRPPDVGVLSARRSHCPSACLARTKGSRGAATAKPDPRARRAARAASEVRSAVTAAGRRAGPRERVTRAAVSRAPRRPPGDAHAGTGRLLLAPQPAAPAGTRSALCRPLQLRAGRGSAWGCPERSQSVPRPPPAPPSRGKEGGRQRAEATG